MWIKTKTENLALKCRSKLKTENFFLKCRPKLKTENFALKCRSKLKTENFTLKCAVNFIPHLESACVSDDFLFLLQVQPFSNSERDPN